MNFLDVILTVSIIWGAVKGFKNGLISEAGAIASLTFGIWAARAFSSTGSEWIQNIYTVPTEYQQIISFTVIFLVVIVVSFFITKLLVSLFESINLGWLNKLLGIVFGGLKFAIIYAFVLLLIITFTNKYSKKPIAFFTESALCDPLTSTAKSVLEGKIMIPFYTENSNQDSDTEEELEEE